MSGNGLRLWPQGAVHPDRDAVLARAALWNGAFERCSVAPAMHLESPLDAFAFLLAAWSRGWAPLLFPDRQPATVEGCSGPVFLELPPDVVAMPLAPCVSLREDVAVRLLTSGSTGIRKEIPKTFAQLEDECLDQRDWSGEDFAGRGLLCTVSHQHVYGLLFLIVRPALEGLRLPVRRDFYWEEMASRLSASPCALVTSPSHLPHLLHGLATSRPADLLLVSSGGAVSEALGCQVARHARLVEIYGSTETGGVARRVWTPEGAGAWLPFTAVTWRIQEEGRLVLESPWADSRPHLTDDLARSEGEGFVLCGRHDRIVKVSEKRLSLDELEAVLLGSPLVSQGRACLLETLRRQEIALAVELSRAGWTLLQEEGRAVLIESLRQTLSVRFEPVLLPKQWRFGILPRTAQGKVPLEELKALFAVPQILLDGIGARLEKTEDGLNALFTVPADYPRLDGHFPGTPVVAGVAQLHWVLDAVRHLDPAFRFGRTEAVKFQSILRPGAKIRLETVRHKDGWRFEIGTQEGRKAASGRLHP